jgi:hypothetical protein
MCVRNYAAPCDGWQPDEGCLLLAEAKFRIAA